MVLFENQFRSDLVEMPEITPDHLADSAGPNLSSSQGIGNTGGATYDFLRFLVPFAHHVQSMYN